MTTRKRFLIGASMFLVTGLFSLTSGSIAFADNAEDEAVSKEKFYYSYAEHAGDDDGYYKHKGIGQDDVHSGWRIGQFIISGYTRVIDNPPDYPVFLKNVGDKVTLSFILEQDIDALNGDPKLSINDDTGWDEYFGVAKTRLGRGALIIGQRDYQNNFIGPTLYTDYLAGVQKGAETEVELCEEGDYEFALDYSLLHKTLDDLWILPTSKVASFEDDYQILFGFSVRNGNCMVYPMDVKTDAELTNKAFTPNGFYLDLARSRYLDIDITKQIYTEGATGLTEDTRFNRPARDGEKFTDEGVYTITVKNNYTNRETEKIIYVGDNDIVKAYVSNPNYTIPQIKNLVSEGATILSDGSIKMPDTTTAETITTPTTTTTITSSESATSFSDNENGSVSYSKQEQKEAGSNKGLILPIILGIIGASAVSSLVTVLILRKHRKPGDSQ